MSESIEPMKKKLNQWLFMESFQPEEIDDLKAFFNFKIKVQNLNMNVLQPRQNADSIIIVTKISLDQTSIDMLKGLDDKTRTAFARELRFALVSRPAIGIFQLLPDMEKDIREMILGTNRIFYEELSKSKLVSAIGELQRSLELFNLIFAKYSDSAKERLSS